MRFAQAALCSLDELERSPPSSSGGYEHYVPGGHTAIKIGGEHFINPTREFVVDGGGAEGSAEGLSPLVGTSDGIEYVVVFTSTRLAREQHSIAPYFAPMHFTDVVRRVGVDCGLLVRAPAGGFTIAPSTVNLIRENT